MSSYEIKYKRKGTKTWKRSHHIFKTKSECEEAIQFQKKHGHHRYRGKLIPLSEFDFKIKKWG